MRGSEVLTSVVKCRWVKCSESLSNRVPNIIRRYIDHKKFAVYIWLFRLSHSFVVFWAHFFIAYMIVLYAFA